MLTLAITLTDAHIETIKVAIEYTILALAIGIVALIVREYFRKLP